MSQYTFKPNLNSYVDIIDINAINSGENKNTSNTSNTPNIQNKTYSLENYNVNLSYNSSNSIYIEIIFNINYSTYTTTIRTDDIINPNVDLDMLFYMMVKSFETKPNSGSNYQVSYEFNDKFLNLTFIATFDKLFVTKEVIRLEERILSDDKLLSSKLNEMEINYENKIKLLNEKIYELSNTEIVFGVHPTEFGKFFTAKPNDDILDFTTFDTYLYYGNYWDLNKLKSLKKIIMFDANFKYQRNIMDIYCVNVTYNYVIGYNSYNSLLNHLKNFLDVQMIYLPSVVELVIRFKSSGEIPQNLRSIPNLHTLVFENFANNQLNTFELIKSIQKLKKLVFKSCLNIGNLDEIKCWSGSRNIVLVLE